MKKIAEELSEDVESFVDVLFLRNTYQQSPEVNKTPVTNDEHRTKSCPVVIVYLNDIV